MSVSTSTRSQAFHQKTTGSSSQEEEREGLAFATDDEWVIDEAKVELHEQMRKSKYIPRAPIPLEYLDSKRRTIMEFSKDRVVTQQEEGQVSELPATKSTDYWKGRTIFRILAGGIAGTTSVPPKTRDPTRAKAPM